MGADERGTLRVIHAPERAIPAAAAWLAKLSKNPDTERAARALTNLPHVIARGAPRAKAELIIERLAKLGVTARFEPDADEGPSVRDSIVQQETVSPPPVLTAPRYRRPRLRPILTAVVAVVVFCMALVIIPPRFGITLLPLEAIGQESGGKNYKDEYLSRDTFTSHGFKDYYVKVSGKDDLLARWDYEHAPSFDHRLANGLTEAILSVLRMRGITPEASIAVMTRATRLDVDHFTLTYDIAYDQIKSSYTVTLSNRANDLDANFTALSRALREFMDSLPPPEKSGARSQDANQIAIPGSPDAALAIPAILKAATAFESSGERRFLLTAVEGLSWLAFIQNHDDHVRASDLAGALASAAWLAYLAGGPENPAAPDATYHQGLLYLALGYPGPALAPLKRAGETHRRATSLVAYITGDIKELRLRAMRGTDADGLDWLLGARSLIRFSRQSERDAANQAALQAQPGFLGLRETIMASGYVGMKRMAAYGYIPSLLCSHLYLLENIADSGKPFTETQFCHNAESPGEDDLEGWFKAHGAALDSVQTLKERGSLVTPQFLRDYLRAEAEAGFWAEMSLRLQTLGLEDEKKRFAALADSAFPGSDVATALRLYLGFDTSRADHAQAAAKKADPSKAGPLTLKYLALIARWSREIRGTGYAAGSVILRQALNKLNPNDDGLWRISSLVRELNQGGLLHDVTLRLYEVDPFSPMVCARLTEWEQEGSRLSECRVNLGNHPTFYTGIASSLMERGRDDDALAYIHDAIGLFPFEVGSYQLAEDILKKRKDWKGVITTLERYPKKDPENFGDMSLVADLARAYRMQGNHAKAFELMQEPVKTHANWALIGYALAAEGVGNLTEAEEYLLKASKRYPTSVAPARMGLFKIRHGDREGGVRFIRDHLKGQNQSYFTTTALEEYEHEGRPGEILRLLLEVRKNAASAGDRINLAEELAEVKAYPAALEALEPVTRSQSKDDFPYLAAANYYQYTLDSGGDGKKTLEDLLSRLAWHDMAIEVFALHLIRYGHYDEAFTALAKAFEMADYRRNERLAIMGIAFFAGSRDQAHRVALRSYGQKVSLNPWQKNLLAAALGDMTLDQLLAGAKDRGKASEAVLYAAMDSLRAGDEVSGTKLLSAVMDTRMTFYLEYDIAGSLLNQKSKIRLKK